MKTVKIYTDGGCEPNPGYGGWGAIILEDGQPPFEMCGHCKNTTNNRMELTAVIEAISHLNIDETNVTIYSDSKYVTDAFNKGWLRGWLKKDLLLRDRINGDLFYKLNVLTQIHKVSFVWVKAHSGIRWNERADELATEGRLNIITEETRSHPSLEEAISDLLDKHHGEVMNLVQSYEH